MAAISGIVFARADILLALLLYPLLGWAYWRWMRPHLPAPARFLFFLLLSAQLGLLMAFAVTGEQYGSDLRWLWHLDGEWNIVSSFAALQLALVGSLALVAARSLFPRGDGRYWLAVSVSYYLIAGYEYLSIQAVGLSTFLRVVLGGSALGLALATVFWLPRVAGAQARFGRWLIAGLALSVLGAEGLDRFENLCLPAGLFGAPERCVWLLPFEEMMENVGALIAALAALGVALQTRPEVDWRALGRRTLVALGLSALVLLVLSWRIMPPAQRILLPNRPALLTVEGVRHEALVAGEVAKAQIELLASTALPAPIGYTLQLIDPLSGEVLAAVDRWSKRRPERWPVGEGVAQELSLNIPEDAPANYVLWLALSLWWHDGVNFSPLSLNAGEWQQLTETLVKMSEVVLLAPTAEAIGDVGNFFAMGFNLQESDIPERARAGETLTVTFGWQAKTDGQENWQQFLHFTHEESGALWNHDQPPLGERLPTHHWYAGLVDQERWQFTLPADLAPGRYQVHTGLYRLSDGQRAPAWDEAGMPWPDAKVALGTIEVHAP